MADRAGATATHMSVAPHVGKPQTSKRLGEINDKMAKLLRDGDKETRMLSRVLEHTLFDLKNQWDMSDSSRQTELRTAVVAFSAAKLSKEPDVSSFAVAKQLCKGIVCYCQEKELNLWKDTAPVTAYIYHPASGFIVVRYRHLQVAMFHALGYSNADVNNHKLNAERRHIIIAIHGASGEGTCGFSSVCVELSPTNTVEKLVFANAPSQKELTKLECGLNKVFATHESDMDDTKHAGVVKYYFQDLLPEALLNIRNFRPVIEAKASPTTSNRLDIVAQCFNGLFTEQLDQVRSLNRLLCSKHKECSRKSNETTQKLEALQKEKENVVQYLMEHELFEAFVSGEAPQRKYQNELLESKKNAISHQRERASLKSDLFETKLKLSKLQEENESLMKESAKTKNLYDARLQELQTTISSLQHDLAKNKHLISVANTDAARATQSADELRRELLEVRADNLALKEDSKKCHSSHTREVDEILYEQITNKFNKSFADHVQQSAHGRFILSKYHSDKVKAATDAAHELAYLYWVHDASTKRDGMTWQETKKAYGDTLSIREIDSVLRGRFTIDPDMLTDYINKRF